MKKPKIKCPNCGWYGGPGLISHRHLDGECLVSGSSLLVSDSVKTSIRAKKRLAECREWLRTLLGGRCTSCGELNGSVLQFEHRNGGGRKEQTLSRNHTAIRYDRWYRHGKITEEEISKRLTLSCRNCNALKGTMTEKEWGNFVRSGEITRYAQRLFERCPYGNLPRTPTQTNYNWKFTIYPPVFDKDQVTDPPYPSGPTA